MNTVGLIGLGRMGHGMASTLLRNGYRVVGMDAGMDQRTKAAAIGVEVVETATQLCQAAQVILLSLPNAAQVEAVVGGVDGLIEAAQSPLLVIDTSTSEPTVTRRIAAQLSEYGHAMLDAPVSGGPAGAEQGALVMVVGGNLKDVNRARPLLEALSSKIVHLGEVGSGHTAKLINNLLCATHLVTTAEAVRLGAQAGLAPEQLLEGINAGSGRSAVSEVNFPRWVLNQSFDSGFTMQLMRKDLRLAQQLIDELDLYLPFSSQVASTWADSESRLGDGDDFNRMAEDIIEYGSTINQEHS